MAVDRIHDLTVGIPAMDDDPRVLGLALDAVAGERLGRRTIVVDMSRGDAVASVVRDRDDCRYVRFAESRGVSDSRNRLAALTETRYLLMIDADAVPVAGWARAMRTGFDIVPDVAVVGARIVPVWPGQRPPFMFDTQPAYDMLGMFDLGGARRFVPRIMGTSYALDLHRAPAPLPFAPDVGRRPGSLLGGEEVVYCATVGEAGWRVLYEPAALVRHHLRADRGSWRWMLSRARVAGRESRLYARQPPSIERAIGLSDHLFRCAIAPSFLLGRLEGAERAPRDGPADEPGGPFSTPSSDPDVRPRAG